MSRIDVPPAPHEHLAQKGTVIEGSASHTGIPIEVLTLFIKSRECFIVLGALPPIVWRLRLSDKQRYLKISRFKCLFAKTEVLSNHVCFL